MVNSQKLIITTECLTLYTRCRINRCRYNLVQLYYYKLESYTCIHLVGLLCIWSIIYLDIYVFILLFSCKLSAA